MPYFKYSYFWPDNNIDYYWEVPLGEAESAATTEDGKIEPMPGDTSCITKYEKLPLYLKSCLDYCAFDTDINSTSIGRIVADTEEYVRLMVAEGLIEEKESVTAIKVSDPYHKLCVVKGSRDDFVARNSHHPLLLFVRLYDGNDISPCLRNLPIQSLFLIVLCNQLSPANADAMRGLGSMFVLSTVALKSQISFNAMGELVNLRYLLWSNFPNLPTLSNLQYLQTLEVTDEVLPEEVVRLKNLRHLIPSFFHSFRLRRGIGRLVNLRSLVGRDARSDVTGELCSLTAIRRLRVHNVVEKTVEELLEAIMTMKNLAHLSLEAHRIFYQDEYAITVFPLLEPFSPPPFLQELILVGSLMEIPSWFASMNNLTTLDMCASALTENPSTILQFLPKLKHLCLDQAYNTKLIGTDFCGAGGIPKLEYLKIRSDALVDWTEIVMGAFPSLRWIDCYCKNLLFFPEGLQNIFTLKKLRIGVHEDLIRMLNGDENYKIKHVPSVTMFSPIE